MRKSLVVSGLLRDGIGLGEASRGYAWALDAGGYWVRQHVQRMSYRQDPVGDPGPSGLLPFEQVLDDVEADLVVTCLNPPELRDLRLHRTMHPAGRAHIGVWAWEVDPAPPEWADEAGRFDEIWVYTEHIARAIRPVVPCEVVAIPPPVFPGRPSGRRSRLLDDRPTFVSMADGASSLARKNPLGAVEAFRRAFAPDEGPRLLIKVWNLASDPAAAQELTDAVRDRPDIDLVDTFLDREDFVDLLAGSRGLVSLHRAEGLGLPIFEALSLGVPVVMTAWSGPVEIVDERHVFQVRHDLVRSSGTDVYAGTIWAEPDLDDAAEQLRTLWDQPAEAASRAEAGRRLVEENLSAAAIGRRLAPRVDALLERSSSRSPRSPIRPALGVVTQAADPWPAVAPFVRAVAPQLISQGAELVIAVASPEVLPPEHRPRNVTVIDAGTPNTLALRTAPLAECDADLIVVTQDHCIPAPGWLLAYDAAYHVRGGKLLAGAIGNGAMGSAADWANYLIGFAWYAPPLEDIPEGNWPTIANCAVDGEVLRSRLGTTPDPSALDHDLIPSLWRSGEVSLVPDAVVFHTQGHPGWRHVLNHFDDARMAGSWMRDAGDRAPSLRPSALRAEAQAILRGLQEDIPAHPDLLRPYERAQYWLRALAGARVAGLAIGARFGPGRRGERVD